MDDTLRVMSQGIYDEGAIWGVRLRGNTYDFAKVADTTSSGIYPRGHPAPRYRYTQPLATGDGWPVASPEEVGISQSSIEQFVQLLIDLDADPAPHSPPFDRLELLSVLVEACDEEHYPVGSTATPQSIIEFLLDQHGMTRADLASILGGRSRVSEFFAGKRRLSISQILKLRKRLGVPADLLLDEA